MWQAQHSIIIQIQDSENVSSGTSLHVVEYDLLNTICVTVVTRKPPPEYSTSEKC